MTPPKRRLFGTADRDQQAADRTVLVKKQMQKESADQDAKTARLKALRLAQEAADKKA